MILKDIYFFNQQTITGESSILSNENKGNVLSIQVSCSSSFNITVKGMIDSQSGIFNNLYVINMANGKTQQTLTSEGIYQIDISGYKRIKLVLNSIGSSPLTAYGVMKSGSDEQGVEKEYATKKYVDDSISEAIGEIDAVLETLTTPGSEGDE